MNDTLNYLVALARFPASLWSFQRRPRLTLEEARRVVLERMAQRGDNFVNIVEQRVFNRPRSPYLALMRQAGFTLDDVRALVRDQGLEGALQTLRAGGVYVTFEEFKGRKPIVRPGLELPVTARDFENPTAQGAYRVQTSGSTGAASSIGVNLRNMAARAPMQMVCLAAQGVLDVPVVEWRGILPDVTFNQMLTRSYMGKTTQRWFSHIGLRDSRHWLKYGLTTYYIWAWMRLCGLNVPAPEYVPLNRAEVVAQAVAQLLRQHGRCLLHTQVSRALRVCDAALDAGLDLTGLVIKAGGEPPTPGKVQRMQTTGAHFMPNYAMTGTGPVGAGCGKPAYFDDLHLVKDSFALFTFPHTVEGFDMVVPAFNLTMLLESAPQIMINVQMDDYGIVEERPCGCDLEEYGYTTHIREIRSYSKLTGEGVTLIGTEMVRILEEVLPARFGGGPLDYQLMEHEDNQGYTRLMLLVHPRVTIADEQAVVTAVLEALGHSSSMADAARTIWQNANTLQIKRAEPVWTSRGKMQPLHIQRRLS